MKRNHLSPLLLVLALVLVATAAQAAGSAPASLAAPVASVAASAPATAVELPSMPAWDPAILTGLPVPGEMKSELPPAFLPPSFCPPPCIACIAPRRCTGPCQVHSGCTICACS
jgi:hypothetical protein